MRGFFSFLLVFFLLFTLIIALNVFQEKDLDLKELERGLIEIEQNNMKRSVMENNIDKIISVVLSQKSYETNNVVEIKKAINEKLFDYLKEKAFATNLFFDSKQRLTPNFLNKNSTVAVYEINGLFYAEYTYTSDITKQEHVGKKIGDKTKIVFRIPIDYSKKMLGGKI